MRVCGRQYREELILNVTVFVVRVWGGQYREELLLNITVRVVRTWVKIIEIYFLRFALNCGPEPAFL